MLDTQSILTYATEAFTFFYVCVTVFDFAAGLLAAWQNAGTKAQVPVESEPVVEQAIAPQIDSVSTLADSWTEPVEQVAIALPAEQQIIKPQLLLSAAAQKIATLQWVQENMPAAEIYTAELPDVIILAKSCLPKVAPVIQLATREQLIYLGIRRCKRLASQLKVRRYNVMKLSELADVLVGKIAVSDLVA